MAFLAADKAVESWRAGFVAALNFVVYAGFVVQYVPTYRHLESAFGNPPDDAAMLGAEWGGLAGFAASVGISGIAVALVTVVPGWYLVAIGLFVFGLTMWMLAIGSAVVVERVSRERADAEGSPMAAVGD